MGAVRLAILATVVSAFLIAPAALLAEEPTTEPTADSTQAPTDVDPAAAPTAAQPTVAETSIETSSKPPTARAAASATATASSASVTIGDFFFRPKDVTISVGDSVTWTNDGKVEEGHTVTGNGFDSGVLKPGAVYTHRFATAGTFDYVCTIHPNMRGTVTVTASASGGGGNGSGGGSSSGSGSSAGGSSSSSNPTPTEAGSSGGGSLASTGLNLVLLAEIGMCLFVTGLLVRRLTFF